jgi:hypothetical protein
VNNKIAGGRKNSTTVVVPPTRLDGLRRQALDQPVGAAATAPAR